MQNNRQLKTETAQTVVGFHSFFLSPGVCTFTPSIRSCKEKRNAGHHMPQAILTQSPTEKKNHCTLVGKRRLSRPSTKKITSTVFHRRWRKRQTDEVQLSLAADVAGWSSESAQWVGETVRNLAPHPGGG